MCTNSEKLNQAKEWLMQYHAGKSAKQNIEQLEIAIEIEKKGEYGKCQICGRSIGYTAIQAQPHLSTCMNCGLTINSFLWASSSKYDWVHEDSVFF